MPPVVVASGPNNFNFGVCDFGPSPPTSVSVDPPAIGGSPVVACQGTMVIAGDANGSQVQLVDITNPAAPVVRGSVNLTGFGGIGAVAINGTLAAAGERNGFRCALIDISAPNSPTVVGMTSTGLGGFGSLAFAGARIVVGGGPNGPPTAVRIDFNPATPVVSTLNTAFSGGSAVAGDAVAGRIVVGNRNGNQVVLMDAAGNVLVSTTASFTGVTSVAVSGALVLAAGSSSFTFDRINFGPSPPARTTVNPGYSSGSVVAISGTRGACGAIVGGTTVVKILDLAPATPVVGASCNPGVQSVGFLSMGVLVGAPPVAPAISVTPTMLAFGSVRVGNTRVLGLTIRNTGTAALNVTNVQSSSARFTFSPGAPLTIQPNQQTTVNVTFAPNAEQAFPGNLTIASNDPGKPTVTVALAGNGALPHIGVSPASVTFGSVPVCLQGGASVTIQNTGGLDLTVSSISTNSPFAATPASAVVPAGGTRTVALTFTPGAVGPASGTLTISSDDPANPTRTVTLSATGAPTPPPVLSPTPAALAFGAVPRQYFAGMRLTIANGGPCQALSVTLSTSGAPFSVTDTDASPGSGQLGPVTINPGVPGRFAVVFAPTALGTASGTLTITSNDPNNPTRQIALSGDGVDPAPTALELVLDRSGSMSDPVVGGTKMDALKRAVDMFADLVIPSRGDEMGVVAFDDQFSVLTARGAYDVAKQTTVKNDVATLTPRGMTSIGGGLQLGQGQLAGSSLARKAILVMTDGIENTPPMIATVEPGILAAGTEIYAVGFGQPQTISAQALSQLAASSNGRFFVDADPLILRKNFVQVLADAFRQNMAADPVHTIKQGQVLEIPVWITDCERRISFVLNWDDPSAQLGLELEAPDGTVFTATAPSSNQLVRYSQQPAYRLYQVAFAPLDTGGYIGPRRSGKWLMRVFGAQVAGSQRFTASVIVESDLRLETRLKGSDAQQPLVLELVLSEPGGRISKADVAVTVLSPTKTLSQVLGRAALQRFVHFDELTDAVGLTVLERAVRTLSAKRKLIPTRRKKHKPTFSRGVFTVLLPPPLVPGVYHFEIELVGQACGGTFQRYASFDYALAQVANAGSTTVSVTTPTTGVGVVTVTPSDAQGRPLGPGLAPAIGGTVSGGEITGVIDNLDGSYIVYTTWSRRTKKPILRLEVAGARLDVPLVATKRSPGERGASRGTRGVMREGGTNAEG